MRADIRTRVPDHEVAAVQNVRFSTALRGYDRDEVDRYMTRVNQVLAELQITAAPKSAIKHALEQVSRDTKSVVREARQEADEITRQLPGGRSHPGGEAGGGKAARSSGAGGQAAARSSGPGGTRHTGGRRDPHSRARADVQAMIDKRDRAVEELVELSRSLDELLKRNGRNGDRPSVPEPARAG